MQPSRRGFTLIELVIALVIGSILTSIALAGFGNARGPFAVRGARNTMVSMHARARAHAIEKGQRVVLYVDPGGDSVSITTDSTVIETIYFGSELNVDIQTGSGSAVRLCMNPRGYATEACNSFTTPMRVTFWHNADSASVGLLTLGQLVY